METPKLQKLLNHSYAPYSRVSVGAVLVTNKGEFEGVNVENAAFPSSICAERSAILHAVSAAGASQDFLELHIISSLPRPLYPCGACLQVMTEFFTDKFPIYIYANSGEKVKTTLGALIPMAPTNLKKDIKNWK